MKFLLYGAYGYTGKLITELAKDAGLTPVLAGRNEAKLKPLAEQFGYEYKVLSLDKPDQLRAALASFDVVLHAAGPFKYTCKPMLDACLETGTHYLDITGEIEVFELAKQHDEQAQARGIMLMPGVGFDVVPTDCTAAYLKQQMPDAINLELAFASDARGPGFSHGTAMTMIEGIGEGGLVRKDGTITKVPAGYKTLTIPFWDKERFAMTIPWGDVSTAHFTTGIPNIETYMAVHPKMYKNARRSNWLAPILRLPFVKNKMRKKIDQGPEGPTPEQRAKASSYIWGRATNAAGQQKECILKTQDGYTLTALTSLEITKKVLQKNVKPGYQTPAAAYGADLIMEFEGSERKDK